MTSSQDSHRKWLSEIQSARARKPRKRTSVARQAVRAVISESNTPLDRLRHRGGCLRAFRHQVGSEYRVICGDDVEITTHFDSYGKPYSYEFFSNDTFRREVISDSTLRDIAAEISREI